MVYTSPALFNIIIGKKKKSSKSSPAPLLDESQAEMDEQLEPQLSTSTDCEQPSTSSDGQALPSTSTDTQGVIFLKFKVSLCMYNDLIINYNKLY